MALLPRTQPLVSPLFDFGSLASAELRWRSCLALATLLLLFLTASAGRRRRKAARQPTRGAGRSSNIFVQCIESTKEAVAGQVAGVLASVVVQLTDPEGPHLASLFRAMAGSMRAAGQDEHLNSAMQESALEMMRSERMHAEVVQVMTGALVAVSRSKELRAALVKVVKESLGDETFTSDMRTTMLDTMLAGVKNKALMNSYLKVGRIAITHAMNDASFVSDVTTAMTNAGMTVMSDENRRESMSNAMKLAMVNALRDEELLGLIGQMLSTTMRDGSIYRGAARGMLGALNPLARRRHHQLQQELADDDSSESGSSTSRSRYRSASRGRSSVRRGRSGSRHATGSGPSRERDVESQ